MLRIWLLNVDIRLFWIFIHIEKLLSLAAITFIKSQVVTTERKGLSLTFIHLLHDGFYD